MGRFDPEPDANAPPERTALLAAIVESSYDAIIEKDLDGTIRAWIGDVWVISVRDEGIGIDASEQNAVFDFLRRLHARDAYEGTGLGLAFCRRIVERHGGRIWVDSQPEQGSCFSFTVPKGLAGTGHPG